ncbi:MAG: methyltransferase domain-containing protein [Candidatus Eisenbacteria bacterium]|nr:methyltransferase domain-containing protein [Candidatus Eisenbacteria bacterium]
MNLIAEKVQKYLEDLHPVSDPVVKEMEQLGRETDFPIVGPMVGRLLEISARLTQSRNVLELGSGFGYSAYWLLRGMEGGGRLTLTETRPDRLQLARKHLSRTGTGVTIDYRQGDAMDVLEESGEPLDLVFCDFDKPQYPRVIEPVARRLRPRGLFLTDNTLWSGRVAEADPDETTRAIQVFNRLLLRDGRFRSTILPIRDGVALAIRLPD